MAKTPINRRYIRVVEPWGGGHTPWDTGLGNRLLHFEIVYQLYKANNFEFFLELEEKYWQELNYIDLPGYRTFRVKSGDADIQKFVSKFDFDMESGKIEPLKPLGNEAMEEFLDKGTHELKYPRYYTNFDWKYVSQYHQKHKGISQYTGLSKITVKEKTLYNLIRTMGSYCVGVHLRRGAGVFKSPKDMLELPNSVRANPNLHAIHKTTIYKYWKNNVYEKLIAEMLQLNPNQKIYVSCDLQIGEYEFLKDKFGDNIRFRKDIIDALPPSFTSEINFNNVFDRKKIALESVIDMMVLSYCEFLIGATHSSWLDAILKMKPIPHSFIHEPRDKILNNYKKAIKNSRGVL